MARFGVVDFSGLDNWNTSFLLGDVSVEKDRIRSAEAQILRANRSIKKAQAKISAARRSMAAISDRLHKMKEGGKLLLVRENKKRKSGKGVA